jgi:hypothetical protein
MQNFTVRVIPTKTYMGKDDELRWHYIVPAVSPQAAVGCMRAMYPDADEIKSMGSFEADCYDLTK